LGQYLRDHVVPITPQSANQPLGSADAIVTILLLIPGLLLSRLDIPSHKTVLGKLRLIPRYVAYLAVIVSSTLALVVAAGNAAALQRSFLIALTTLVLLIVLTGLDGLLKAAKRRALVPNCRAIPRWLIYELRRTPQFRRRRCTVEFSTIGRDSHV
jgi:hypothetical protein